MRERGYRGNCEVNARAALSGYELRLEMRFLVVVLLLLRSRGSD